MFYALTVGAGFAALLSILFDDVRAFSGFVVLGVLFGACYWAIERGA